MALAYVLPLLLSSSLSGAHRSRALRLGAGAASGGLELGADTGLGELGPGVDGRLDPGVDGELELGAATELG